MTPAALLASARTLIEGNPDAAGFIDRCTVIKRTRNAGTAGGNTITETTMASGIPCIYEEKNYPTPKDVASRPQAEVTHTLFLIASTITRAITSEYRIVVAARSDTPQLNFDEIIRLDETFDPVVTLGAVLQV